MGMVNESESVVLSVKERQAFLSIYPLTDRITDNIKRECNIEIANCFSLADIVRERSLSMVFRALRQIDGERLWLVISDHNYQPMLPLMLVLAFFTRACDIRIVDFAGQSYPVSRLQIAVKEPVKLAFGSLRGLWHVLRCRAASAKLEGLKRISARPIRDRPAIAYLKTNLWFGVQAGGSVGHVAGVVNGFSRLGCKVKVFAVEELPLIDNDVSMHRIHGAGPTGLPTETNNYIFHDLFTKKTEVDLRSVKPDVLYQRNCLANFAGVELSRRFEVPLILEYNGSEVWATNNWGKRLRFGELAKSVEEINLKHAHLIVVVSEVLRQELLGRGIADERILFYPNCIDPEVFDPRRFSAEELMEVRSGLGVEPDSLVCTFIGTFGPWHGADVLAKCVVRLSEQHPSWFHRAHFLFVGDGGLMPCVKEILRPVSKNRYTLTGLVPQADAPKYLAASDILLSPHVPNPDGSRFFGSPTKLFEYMAMEKPIIASELEQIGDIFKGSWHIGRNGRPSSPVELDGSAALLVKPGSEDDLIAAIEYLVLHRDAHKTLAQASRALVLHRYTWEQQVASILARLLEMTR